MLGYAVVFFLLAVLAGAFGFGFISSTFVVAAQVAFVLFIALFLITAFNRAFRTAT
jgi:uncharacterized membrane protein YtjA (UPF0391 family)